jgi:DNA-binding HxlR family transcriptional regulator
MTLMLHRAPGDQTPARLSSSDGADVHRDDYALSRLLGQPVRQSILRALLAHTVLSFTEIKRLMDVTDGNLSMHARKLEDAGVLSCEKGFRHRLPRTEYRLTDAGREAALRLFAAADLRTTA